MEKTERENAKEPFFNREDLARQIPKLREQMHAQSVELYPAWSEDEYILVSDLWKIFKNNLGTNGKKLALKEIRDRLKVFQANQDKMKTDKNREPEAKDQQDNGEFVATPKRRVPLKERLDRISEKMKDFHNAIRIEDHDLIQAYWLGKKEGSQPSAPIELKDINVTQSAGDLLRDYMRRKQGDLSEILWWNTALEAMELYAQQSRQQAIQECIDSLNKFNESPINYVSPNAIKLLEKLR